MFITAIVFFVILSVLVLIHEFGHFLTARFFGVRVEEFGFGLPPRIIGKKINGTIYSINWLPIGGFVHLAGEDMEEGQKHTVKSSQRKQYFWARSKKERSAILVAGVVMNFVLAVGLTTFLLTQGVPEPSGRVRIERIQHGSPADEAGLIAGDIVSGITYQVSEKTEERTIKIPRELIEITRKHLGEPIILTILRESSEQKISLVPRKDAPAGQGPIGVAISDLEPKYFSLKEAPVEAVKITFFRAREMLKGIGLLLWRVLTLQPVKEEVSGPIGIAVVTGEAVKFGWKAVLEFMSILSLNLAVLNILPIPALDGGRLAFVFAEKLFGRRLRPAFEQKTHQLGMIILIFLILLISINDILRLARGS